MNFDLNSTITLPLIFAVVTMIYTWFRTRNHNVDGRLGGLESRLQAAEQEIKAMPAKDDMHRLEIALSDIAGDIKAMRVTVRSTNEAMDRIDRVVSRHDEHLLDGGKGK